jgi:hypothetical protein
MDCNRMGQARAMSNYIVEEELRPKARIALYTFKKRKPIPGAYPLHYSPYRLASTSPSRVTISLSRQEILPDLLNIQCSLSSTFKSQYFDESGVNIGSSASIEANRDSVLLPKKPISRTIGRQRPKKSNDLAAPQTLEEERRQIRAAIRASKALLSTCLLPNLAEEQMDLVGLLVKRRSAPTTCRKDVLNINTTVQQAPLLNVAD